MCKFFLVNSLYFFKYKKEKQKGFRRETMKYLLDTNIFLFLLSDPGHSNHLYQISGLPWIHNDPFDRLLVAQCLEEKISLVSTDKILEK